MNRFVVMGDPIQHSLSPVIHSLFAEQFNIDIEYTKLETNQNNLQQRINEFFDAGGKGVNLTSPLKETAIKYIANLSSRAKEAQSVNTLYLKDGVVFGDNTDGVGFMKSLEIEISDRNILILGAGGSVKGIIHDIVSTVPSSIHIVNRNTEKANLLASKYNHITTSSYEKLNQKSYDIVINTTSVLDDNIKIFEQLNIQAEYFLDLQYNKRSGFYNWCLQEGIQRYYSGLRMFIEQAAEGFYIWHGVKPNTSIVLEKLQKEHL